MNAKRSHQVVFFEDALPSIFHQSPSDFLNYLERDGNKFLHFYWDQVGKNLAAMDRMDAYGLNYTIRKPQAGVTIAIVLLPAPQASGEAYFEAFVYRPSRITPILRISDMTSVFALTMAGVNGDVPRTRIIEKARKGQTLDQGVGPYPAVEDFYQAVIELIRDSRGDL